MLGNVDYTLAKRSVVAAFRRGLLGRQDVCDAHPELIRAARNIGIASADPCPVCAEPGLRHVRYVFGDQLKAMSGRVVYPNDMVRELASEFDEFRCYLVEVCVECHWNHLLSCELEGRSYSSADRRKRAARAPRP